jgi:hypothetical protein
VARAWKRTRTPEDVRERIEADVPPGSDKAQAEAWLRTEGIEYSDEGDVLRFTLKGPARSLLVGVTWLVAMRLSDGRLAEIEVDEGLTGP